jgi:hypothetical protein
VQALYVLGVVTASAAAMYSAIVVGVEKQREDHRHRHRRMRPELYLVQTSGNPAGSISFERALNSELRRRTRDGAHRRSINN